MDQAEGRQPERASLLGGLLRRVASGDAVAFRALYDLQVRRLTGIALRIVRDPALARDVVHDALLDVWRQAGQFDPARGTAEVWLLSIVRHRALRSVRRQRRETPGHAADDAPDLEPGPLDRLLGTLDGEALHACLDRLEPRQRQVILLAYVEGLSHTELAARLGLPLGTIKSTVRRGLQALRRCLER